MGTIAQKLQAILSSKSAIKSAIEAKGVTVGNAPLDEYAGLIEEISTGSGGADTSDATATAADIASGKTAYIATGKVTGTMPANKFKSLVDRSITSVTADDLDGLTTIGGSAFTKCKSLTNVTLPNSVKIIGINSFRESISLTGIAIPDSVLEIRNASFMYDSGLRTVVIGAGVTVIDGYVFYGCSGLQRITIYATTPPTLGDSNAFGGTNDCPIYVPAASVNAYKTATNWTALAGRIFAIQELAFTSNGDGTCYVSGIGTVTDTNITIPSVSPAGDNVVAVGESAFNDDRSITSVEFSPTIQTIGLLAFSQNTSITSFVIPSNTSLSSIGQRAFQYCTAVRSVLDLGENLTSIGEGAFYECRNLSGIIIRATTPPTLGDSNAFYSSTNQYPIYVPSASVNAYKNDTNWSALADRIQPIPSEGLSFSVDSEQGIATVTRIGTCTDTDIVIPNEHKGYAVTAIGYEAFRANTGITSVIIPTSVTSIKSYAFNGCTGLTSIDIPNSVTEIGWYAFSGCNGLTSAIIGNGILKICGYAFRGCSNLVGITILATTPPTISGVSAFESTDDCPIYVPYSADHSVLNAYKAATNWSAFADRIFEIQE